MHEFAKFIASNIWLISMAALALAVVATAIVGFNAARMKISASDAGHALPKLQEIEARLDHVEATEAALIAKEEGLQAQILLAQEQVARAQARADQIREEAQQEIAGELDRLRARASEEIQAQLALSEERIRRVGLDANVILRQELLATVLEKIGKDLSEPELKAISELMSDIDDQQRND